MPLLFPDCKYYHWREYKYVIIRDSLTFIFLGPTNTQEGEDTYNKGKVWSRILT